MVFHWNLNDSKSSQVSRSLLSILTDLNNIVVLDGLHTSSYFQVRQSLYQSFGDCTKSTDYNLYRHHFHDSQFFQFSGKIEVLSFLFVFFQFYSLVSRDSKVLNSASSLLFVDYLLVWSRLGDPFVFQSPKGVYIIISLFASFSP